MVFARTDTPKKIKKIKCNITYHHFAKEVPHITNKMKKLMGVLPNKMPSAEFFTSISTCFL